MEGEGGVVGRGINVVTWQDVCSAAIGMVAQAGSARRANNLTIPRESAPCAFPASPRFFPRRAFLLLLSRTWRARSSSMESRRAEASSGSMFASTASKSSDAMESTRSAAPDNENIFEPSEVLKQWQKKNTHTR